LASSHLQTELDDLNTLIHVVLNERAFLQISVGRCEPVSLETNKQPGAIAVSVL
jgi:hypothetical protein